MGPSPTSPTGCAPLPAFELRPSRGLLVAVLLTHLAALAPAVAIAGLHPAWRVLWLLAVLADLAFTLWRHQRPLAGAVARVSRDAEGRWCLEDGRGQRWRGTPADVIAQPWLCVLRVGTGLRARTVLIPADACSPEQHRWLRRALRE